LFWKCGADEKADWKSLCFHEAPTVSTQIPTGRLQDAIFVVPITLFVTILAAVVVGWLVLKSETNTKVKDA